MYCTDCTTLHVRCPAVMAVHNSYCTVYKTYSIEEGGGVELVCVIIYIIIDLYIYQSFWKKENKNFVLKLLSLSLIFADWLYNSLAWEHSFFHFIGKPSLLGVDLGEGWGWSQAGGQQGGT